MKIYYIANARMPSEKAHGIQIAKMCEAYIALGADLTLIVPSRGSGALKEAYGLTRHIPLRRVPVLNLQALGRIGYALTALQFMAGALMYVGTKILQGEAFVLYTVDMDTFSFIPFAWMPRPLVAEMHSVKKSNIWTRSFFKRAGIIATNTLIKDDLARTFRIPETRICVEPNGVDESLLHSRLSQKEALEKLALPNKPFALYVGRFYGWKGLEILADAAGHTSLPIYVVGGTRQQYENITKKNGDTIHFFGARPVSEIPRWLTGAEVLVVLGTARNADSYRYTSPMKIFEYLAAGRVVVAARTPAVTSIVPEEAAFWYEPDNARSLAAVIEEAYTSTEAGTRIAAGQALAQKHTWRARAERILTFMTHGN